MKPSIAAFALGLAALCAAACQPAEKPKDNSLAGRTEAALIDQLNCQKPPQPANAVNAMLANNLLHYVDSESGTYYFAPTAPMTFLGLPVTYISGFDVDVGFDNVPGPTMLGPAPPPYLQIDLAAPVAELRKRALKAGMTEGLPGGERAGFSIQDRAAYPPGATEVTSSIVCWG